MSPNTAPRAYSYIRFSSPEQRKGDSLRRQTALAEKYAKANNLELDTELNLRDLGISAYRGDNASVGALGAFLRAIQDGLVPSGSYLLVEALDRISRKVARKGVRILEEIVEAGVTLVTLNDGKAYTEESLDGADFLMAILLFMRGNEESATKSKRLKATWIAKRERAGRGEVQTVSVPAWIRATGSAAKDSRNAQLELIPARAALVRRMFDMFLGGAGKAAIAEAFNAEGLETWGGKRNGRRASYWHRTYVFKILTSQTVTGRFTPYVESHEAGRRCRTAQSPIADYYPRVIDDEIFNRVQTLIGSRKGTVRSATVASIVAGLAKCPRCGSTMTRVFKGAGPKGGSPKLVCVNAKAGAGCEYRSVNLPDVERAFVRNALQLGKPPIAETGLAEDIYATNDEFVRVLEQIESLVDAIERGPSKALTKRLEEREVQAEKLRSELATLRARAAESESRVVALRAKRLSEAASRLGPNNIAEANAALRECVSSVTVDYMDGSLRLAWRHGPTTDLIYDEGFDDLDKVQRPSQAATIGT